MTARASPRTPAEASLKRRLIGALLIVTVLVFVASEAVVLVASRLAIDRALDRELWARADALIRLFEVEPDGSVELEAPFDSTQAVSGTPALVFFRLGRVSDGRELARSPELAGETWPRAPWADGRRAAFGYWDAPLLGRPHRLLSRQFRARRAEEGPPGGAPIPCWVEVGLDRRPFDAEFRAVVGSTVPVSVAGLAVLLILGGLIVRRGLRPLERLAQAVRSLSPDHLEPVGVAPHREVAEVGRALNQLVAQVRSSFERERRFMADVAHELRTPVAEVRALAEVALRGRPIDDDARRDYEEVLAAAERMTTLLDAFLMLARCEAGAIRAGSERVRLDELVRRAWQASSRRLAHRRLTASDPALAPVLVLSSADLLERIVTNLVDNAVSHANPDGLIQCSLEVDGGTLALHIANTADALEPSDIPHLFDRFWRKDAAGSGAHAGLGLSLSRALAESLGLGLEAVLTGEGSTGKMIVLTLSGAAETT